MSGFFDDITPAAPQRDASAPSARGGASAGSSRRGGRGGHAFTADVSVNRDFTRTSSDALDDFYAAISGGSDDGPAPKPVAGREKPPPQAGADSGGKQSRPQQHQKGKPTADSKLAESDAAHSKKNPPSKKPDADSTDGGRPATRHSADRNSSAPAAAATAPTASGAAAAGRGGDRSDRSSGPRQHGHGQGHGHGHGHGHGGHSHSHSHSHSHAHVRPEKPPVFEVDHSGPCGREICGPEASASAPAPVDECVLCCHPIYVYAIMDCEHSAHLCAPCLLRMKLFAKPESAPATASVSARAGSSSGARRGGRGGAYAAGSSARGGASGRSAGGFFDDDDNGNGVARPAASAAAADTPVPAPAPAPTSSPVSASAPPDVEASLDADALDRLRHLPMSCPFCIGTRETVVFARSSDVPFAQLIKSPALVPVPALGAGVLCDSLRTAQHVLKLCSVYCPVCDAAHGPLLPPPRFVTAPAGSPAATAAASTGGSSALRVYRTLRDLLSHLSTAHGGRSVCTACVAGRRALFAHERAVLTPGQLLWHYQHGEEAKGDDGAVPPHPFCRFCALPFFSSDELYAHMLSSHEACRVCHSAKRRCFFRDGPSLVSHFRRDHYVCGEGLCGTCAADDDAASMTVFNDPLDLHAHAVQIHGRANKDISAALAGAGAGATGAGGIDVSAAGPARRARPAVAGVPSVVINVGAAGGVSAPGASRAALIDSVDLTEFFAEAGASIGAGAGLTEADQRRVRERLRGNIRLADGAGAGATGGAAAGTRRGGAGTGSGAGTSVAGGAGSGGRGTLGLCGVNAADVAAATALMRTNSSSKGGASASKGPEEAQYDGYGGHFTLDSASTAGLRPATMGFPTLSGSVADAAGVPLNYGSALVRPRKQRAHEDEFPGLPGERNGHRGSKPAAAAPQTHAHTGAGSVAGALASVLNPPRMPEPAPQPQAQKQQKQKQQDNNNNNKQQQQQQQQAQHKQAAAASSSSSLSGPSFSAAVIEGAPAPMPVSVPAASAAAVARPAAAKQSSAAAFPSLDGAAPSKGAQDKSKGSGKLSSSDLAPASLAQRMASGPEAFAPEPESEPEPVYRPAPAKKTAAQEFPDLLSSAPAAAGPLAPRTGATAPGGKIGAGKGGNNSKAGGGGAGGSGGGAVKMGALSGMALLRQVSGGGKQGKQSQSSPVAPTAPLASAWAKPAAALVAVAAAPVREPQFQQQSLQPPQQKKQASAPGSAAATLAASLGSPSSSGSGLTTAQLLASRPTNAIAGRSAADVFVKETKAERKLAAKLAAEEAEREAAELDTWHTVGRRAVPQQQQQQQQQQPQQSAAAAVAAAAKPAAPAAASAGAPAGNAKAGSAPPGFSTSPADADGTPVPSVLPARPDAAGCKQINASAMKRVDALVRLSLTLDEARAPLEAYNSKMHASSRPLLPAAESEAYLRALPPVVMRQAQAEVSPALVEMRLNVFRTASAAFVSGTLAADKYVNDKLARVVAKGVAAPAVAALAIQLATVMPDSCDRQGLFDAAMELVAKWKQARA